MRRTRYVSAIGFFLFMTMVGWGFSPARAVVFNPESFTLENGMQVVVVSNHRVPVVTHMVWYKVGAADEQPGRSGIAHFLEHLMFKGTETYGPGLFSQEVARNGGKENAFTSQDYTAYFQTVAKDRLEMVMRMEADRMTHLTLTEDQINSERKVILEERHMRTDNNPSAILNEHVDAALFLNHPYRLPVIGWEHEIKALSRDDILAFYKAHYAPNNAILVVAGDITAAELKPLAEKYYGVIPPAPDIKRLTLDEPPQNAERRITLKDSRVPQPQWSRNYIAPSYTWGDTKEAYPLQVAAKILGEGATSRLYRALVIDQKIADSAGAYYRASSKGPSRFVVYATPRPGISMEQLEKAVEGVLDTLRNSGVSDDEVARAVNQIQMDAAYARDSLQSGAYVLGAALATGRTIDDVENWPDAIGAVTRDDVMRAVAAVLVDGHAVTSLLLPKEGEKS